MTRQWEQCFCGCGGLALQDGPNRGRSVIVWAPGAAAVAPFSGVSGRIQDPCKAVAEVVELGAREPCAEHEEFDTLEEAQAWAVAMLRLGGNAP